MFCNGQFLTRQQFVAKVREALQEVGLNHAEYCGHSFPDQGSDHSSGKGLEDSTIKMLGEWEEPCVLAVQQIPRSELAYYSRLLCAPSGHVYVGGAVEGVAAKKKKYIYGQMCYILYIYNY